MNLHVKVKMAVCKFLTGMNFHAAQQLGQAGVIDEHHLKFSHEKVIYSCCAEHYIQVVMQEITNLNGQYMYRHKLQFNHKFKLNTIWGF